MFHRPHFPLDPLLTPFASSLTSFTLFTPFFPLYASSLTTYGLTWALVNFTTPYLSHGHLFVLSFHRLVAPATSASSHSLLTASTLTFFRVVSVSVDPFHSFIVYRRARFVDFIFDSLDRRLGVLLRLHPNSLIYSGYNWICI